MQDYTLLRLFISERNKLTIVPLSSIVYSHANSSYSHVFTNDGGEYILSKSLNVLSREIDFPFMLRISQSAIVNLFYLKHVYSSQKKIELESGITLHYTLSFCDLKRKLREFYVPS